MNSFLKNVIAVTAALALTAIAFCAFESFLFLQDCRSTLQAIQGETLPAVDAAATQIEIDAESANQTIARVNAAVANLNRTIEIAGGAINQARQIERDNRIELAKANQQTVQTLAHADQAIQSVVPVMNQTAKYLSELEPAIRQVTPLLQRSTDIAVNLSNTTADVEHEIHKFVYPPPRKWYQKYLLDPAKVGLHVITIPLGHL